MSGEPQVRPVRPDIIRFSLSLPVDIRVAVADDLANLEWFGQFTDHRAIIREAFAAQQRGENLMLVACANGFPVGQAWVRLARSGVPATTGEIWAVRVFPFLQRVGLGQRLMDAAHHALRRRGYRAAEISVETSNGGARQFYERLGYRVTGSVADVFSYTSPDGVEFRVPRELWIMRRELRPSRRETPKGRRP